MGMPTFQWEQSEIAMEKTDNQDDNTSTGLTANDNRVERAQTRLTNSVVRIEVICPNCGCADHQPFDARVVEVGGSTCPNCGAVYDFDNPLRYHFAASETSELTTRLEAVEKERDAALADAKKFRDSTESLVASFDDRPEGEPDWITTETRNCVLICAMEDLGWMEQADRKRKDADL